MSGPPGDSTTFLGFDTSITRPCGPVPLLASLRFCASLSVFAAGAVSVSAGAEEGAVIGGGRASGVIETATVGEVAEASEEVRDLFGRFAGFCEGSAEKLAF